MLEKKTPDTHREVVVGEEDIRHTQRGSRLLYVVGEEVAECCWRRRHSRLLNVVGEEDIRHTQRGSRHTQRGSRLLYVVGEEDTRHTQRGSRLLNVVGEEDIRHTQRGSRMLLETHREVAGC